MNQNIKYYISNDKIKILSFLQTHELTEYTVTIPDHQSYKKREPELYTFWWNGITLCVKS